MFDDIYRNARVFVTGHTGFKGAWLTEWLRMLGADVTGFSIDVPYSPSAFDALDLRRAVRHLDGDVRRFDALLSAVQSAKPAIVFHLAAQPLVRRSYDEPRATFDTNVTGTLNLLEAVRQTPSVRAAVIVTTDKCYENHGDGGAYRETDRLGGKDPYSASKACAELITHAYQRSFFADPSAARIASARAGNVIGGGDWAEDRIVPDCVRAWTAGRTVLLRNPDHVRPWQHVLEPLGGYLLLGQKLLQSDARAAGEAFNFGPRDANSETVATLVKTLSGGWPGAAWTLADEPRDSKTEATTLRLNCDKARERLQWRPLLSFAESVRLTADWYRAFYANATGVRAVTDDQIDRYRERAAAEGQPWA